jgi:uncharacterized protein YjbJ (UPF0337 family)
LAYGLFSLRLLPSCFRPHKNHAVALAQTMLLCRPEANQMNRDELEGKAESLKGRVKQAAGDLTDNERLHDEGVADEVSGDTKDNLGRARRKVGEAIEDIGENIKR